MEKTSKRFMFVVSTSGSVMDQVLRSEFLRGIVHSVVADRSCEAVDKARGHGLPVKVFAEASNEAFCARLARYLDENRIDYVISFYTKFYSRQLREAYADRIINLHPSLLPSFKGMDGFGDGIAYHAKIIGTTVEFIKDVMDEGKIIMQTACPVDPQEDHAILRHRIFVQQCKTLLQLVRWLVDDRIQISDDQVTVLGSHYGDAEFSPELDFEEAIRLEVPYRASRILQTAGADE